MTEDLTAQRLRDALREEVEALRAEIAQLERDVEAWRTEYYKLYERKQTND